MSGIEQLAEMITTGLELRLPGQRKTQRDKLALLVATMLQVRSANLMDVAACLPRPAERLDSLEATPRFTRYSDTDFYEGCSVGRGRRLVPPVRSAC